MWPPGAELYVYLFFCVLCPRISGSVAKGAGSSLQALYLLRFLTPWPFLETGREGEVRAQGRREGSHHRKHKREEQQETPAKSLIIHQPGESGPSKKVAYDSVSSVGTQPAAEKATRAQGILQVVNLSLNFGFLFFSFMKV